MDVVVVRTDWSFLLLLIVVVGLVLGVLAPRLRQVSESVRLATLMKLAVLILLGFVAMTWTYTTRHAQEVAQEVQVTLPVPPSPEETPNDLSKASASDTVEHLQPDSPLAVTPLKSVGTALPNWTKEALQVAGTRKLVVVKSGRVASADEALSRARKQAANIAALEFRHLDPRGIGDTHPQHADEIQRTAIKQQFLEVTETNYGQFKGPSYQQWLELELTPELGERLAKPWRQSTVDARLRTLAGWSIWATGIAAAMSFALRLDAAWHGRHRFALCLLVILVGAGGLALMGSAG